MSPSPSTLLSRLRPWRWPLELTRRARGVRSEQLARHFLTSQGYAIRETNVRFPVGEIDVVAEEGQTLCFVEVRSTSSSRWGGPLASITDRKRQRLIRAAQWYLQRLRTLPPASRFDVVAIQWEGPQAPTIDLIRDAFWTT